MKKIPLLVFLFAAALILAAGCTQPAPAQPAPVPQVSVTASPVPPAALPDTVKVTASLFGTIIADGQGQTLYFYANDMQGGGSSTCTGSCATTWPAFSTDVVRVSPPLNTADFGTIVRTDGSKQTTYKGRPLYYYTGDLKPGDINGSGIASLWNVANIPGTVVTTPPTTIPTPTQTPCLGCGGGGGGGGY